MGECTDYRCWEEMIPDALGLIFQKLSLQEILTVVPRVCKLWEKAVSGPYCWQEIDIDEWSRRKPDYIDRMLEMLIKRSSGSFRRLFVSGLNNDTIFSFIADHAGSLQKLELPRSEISDAIVEQVAEKFSNLTFLDVSYCGKIGAKALAAFGKHCRSLAGLRRVMHPSEVMDRTSQDDEALAIAHTMPKLKHLEMAYLLITTVGVLEILSGCKNLEFLDVRGCWDVKLDDKFLKEKMPGLKVLGPLIYWDDCSEYSISSGYLSWEFMDDGVGDYDVVSDDDGLWDDGQGLEALEVRFYGGGFNAAAAEFGWPPSP